MMLPRTCRVLCHGLFFVCFNLVGTVGAEETKPEGWDVNDPPGPRFEQKIDATEGTWINLDVRPDGKEIVFDFLGDIYAMPLSGADGRGGRFPRKLTSGMAWDMQPRYSPDGRRIAFTSDRLGKSKHAGDNIWTMDLKGQDLQQITNETFQLVNGPAWSPDGQYLVARKHFTSRRSLGAGEMWLYHRAAEKSGAMAGLQLTKRPNDQKDVNEPIFSPDGKYLYYSQDATPGDTFEYDKDSNKQIYVVKRLELLTGTTETYISGPGGACRPTPSPDGKQIAFVRRLGADTVLHLFNCESGAIRPLYDKLERDMQEAWAIHGVYPAFAWTPDGKSIVVWAKGKIRRIAVQTGQATTVPFHIRDQRTMTRSLRFPVEVAPDKFDVKMLRWVNVAPNGKWVVYQALGHLYLRALPEGPPRRLTRQNEHFEFYPRFSPDSRHVVYSTWDDERLGAIQVTSISDGKTRRITSRPGHYLNPVFSPDGKLILFQRSTGGLLRSALWSREPGIYKIGVDGSGEKRLSKSGRKPQFAADGSRFYFLKSSREKDADNLQLWSMDLEGHDERQHYGSQWGTDYRISPNGKWLAFIERFNVYVTPFVTTGSSIAIGPQAKGIPVAKVSRQAGDGVHFSGDSGQLHWSLGPRLYSQSLEKVFGFLRGDDAADRQQAKPTEVALGFQRPFAKPATTYALVGGRIVTMSDAGVINGGIVLIQGNRIAAVGAMGEVKIPAAAKVIDVSNQVILPGLVDTHAHGPLATDGIHPERNWIDYARLSFGVTTIHDPSNDTRGIFAASELTKAGLTVGPRVFSTGTILYGAAGSYKAEISSLEDALFHLRRMQAVGAISVKSYNQPRRDQRQQVLTAARQLKMMVVPEGGSTFMHNMNMIVDGHTGIEHTLPVQTAYDDVMDLWRNTQVGYTPTLCVAYGGLSGENYWYEVDDLWLHQRLKSFVPPHVLVPRSRRRSKAPREDYNHIRVSEIARQVVKEGGLVQAGGHGQLNGICTHWELWSFVQGGMTPTEALRCGTLYGARYLGLDQDLGSIEAGKLADLVIIERGADPLENIRDTERIHYVVANGRVFDARRMNELGSLAPSKKFYWQQPGYGISGALPRVQSCGCQRPGATRIWSK